MTTSTTEIEAPVDLVLLPITLGLRAGTMRLADGRLSYTRRRRGRVLFDAPVDEFHSFARSSMGTGFHLWHGPTRYRFVVDHPVLPAEYGTSALADVAEAVVQIRQGLAKTARSRAAVDGWHDALVPAIAPAPPRDVDVDPPLSASRFLWTALGAVLAATLLLVAIITAVVAGTS